MQHSSTLQPKAKRVRRALSVLIAFVMVFALLPLQGLAFGEATGGSVSLNSKEGAPGGSVTLTLTYSANAPINALDAAIIYDTTALTLSEIQAGSLYTDDSSEHYGSAPLYPVIGSLISISYDSGWNGQISDGTQSSIKLVFDISETATLGDYEIVFDSDIGYPQVYAVGGDTFDVESTNGKITVTNTPNNDDDDEEITTPTAPVQLSLTDDTAINLTKSETLGALFGSWYETDSLPVYVATVPSGTSGVKVSSASGVTITDILGAGDTDVITAGSPASISLEKYGGVGEWLKGYVEGSLDSYYCFKPSDSDEWFVIIAAIGEPSTPTPIPIMIQLNNGTAIPVEVMPTNDWVMAMQAVTPDKLFFVARVPAGTSELKLSTSDSTATVGHMIESGYTINLTQGNWSSLSLANYAFPSSYESYFNSMLASAYILPFANYFYLAGTSVNGTPFEVLVEVDEPSTPTPDPHVITIDPAIASVGAQVSTTPSGSALEGATVYVQVTPPSYRDLLTLSYVPTAGGESTAITKTANNYSFAMPDFPITISATFSAAPVHDISIQPVMPGASVVTDPDGQASAGATVNLTISPLKYNTGGGEYLIDSVTINGGAVTVNGTGKELSFVMPNSDVNIAVTFKHPNYEYKHTVSVDESYKNIPGGMVNPARVQIFNGSTEDYVFSKDETATITVLPIADYEVESVVVVPYVPAAQGEQGTIEFWSDAWTQRPLSDTGITVPVVPLVNPRDYQFTMPDYPVAVIVKFKEAEAVPVTYTVSFDSNGGSAVQAQEVVEDGVAVVPGVPAKSVDVNGATVNLAFDGWYSDSILATEYDFSTPVTGPVTLYAKWTGLAKTGDFNGDGFTTLDEALLLVQVINTDSFDTLSAARFSAMDIDGDGYLTMADVLMIVQIILNS